MNVNWFVVVVLEVDFWGGAKGGRQWSRKLWVAVDYCCLYAGDCCFFSFSCGDVNFCGLEINWVGR